MRSQCFYLFLYIVLYLLKICVFITFGYAGSLLLLELLSNCREWGLLSSCGAQASHCGGFSCYGAQALEPSGFISCRTWAQQL